jgi:hypothetical protein
MGYPGYLRRIQLFPVSLMSSVKSELTIVLGQILFLLYWF